MLQVDSDVSFLFGSESDKTPRSFANMNNQWQPPAWHHHQRHAPPPSSSHLQGSYGVLSPRAPQGHSRSPNSEPSHHIPHHHQSRSEQYTSSTYQSHHDSYPPRGDYSQYSSSNSHSSQRHDGYYNPESQWSYPVDNSHNDQHAHPPSYMKPSSESGIAIDPLPLRHLMMGSQQPNVNAGPAGFEDELYEARMLQEALTTTTPQYGTRPPPLGGFHHQHHPQSQPPQPQHHSQSQYSSPFVSAVLDATVPLHSHHGHDMYSSMRHSTASVPSDRTSPSASDAVGPDQTGVSATNKRKRRGEAAPRLCRVEGCTKGIRSRGLCKAHGGGRRCMTPGCTTSDQGGGHCVLHGGGRRCTVEACTKSAQWKGLCKMHGGARRCRYPNCTKNGQVKQGYCRAHHNLISKQAELGAQKVPQPQPV